MERIAAGYIAEQEPSCIMSSEPPYLFDCSNANPSVKQDVRVSVNIFHMNSIKNVLLQ